MVISANLNEKFSVLTSDIKSDGDKQISATRAKCQASLALAEGNHSENIRYSLVEEQLYVRRI